MATAIPGMKFETQPGVSLGIIQRQGKNGMNTYGVFAGMGFKHEFYLSADEVSNFPPPDVQCVVYGEIEDTKYGPKFKVHGYHDKSKQRRSSSVE